MMQARYGRIINIASVSGLMGQSGAIQLFRFQGGPDRHDAQRGPRAGRP